ncbi:MAG: TfoX/Sxy family protein [Actinobacteria bacterium]|nr:TfoX/Sxy family protein [Actinomycetota bacterium]
MAFDEDLARRIRDLLAGQLDVTESAMFGGLAFLVGGHMAVTASREGGILVRVDPATADRLVDRTGATVAVMRGRPMEGWLRVDAGRLRTRRQLDAWVRRSTEFARTLPPKPHHS